MQANNADDNNSDIFRENFPNICSTIKTSVSKCCSVKTLKRRIPIVQWLPKYSKSFLFYDIVAGLSVALTLIPQGISYGIVAGLLPQYGLYSSFMGCFIYTIFGSSKDVSVGPTAIMSLMINPFVTKFNVDFAILCFATITAFTTAAAFIIGSGQIRPLLGIKSGSSNDFIKTWTSVFLHLDEIRYTDTLLGLFSLALLILMKKPKCFSRWPVFSKYISISRNAIVVILGMIIAYAFDLNDKEPFRLTGSVTECLSPFQLPPFRTEVNGKKYTFVEMLTEFVVSLVTISLVSILEIVAIAKAFSKEKPVHASQEMLTLGLCNIGSSFFQSIPITGSFTRTAVNHNSGVKTTFGGVITGGIVLMALGFLTKTFYFIPKTTLAAVIIAAMFSMIEIHEIVEIYKTKRIDTIPLAATFLISLWLGLEFGIFAGVVVNLTIVLYKISRPKINFEVINVNNIDILIITPNQSLNFTAAEYFTSLVIKKVNQEFSSVYYILIDGTSIDNNIDVTVIKNFASLVVLMKDCEKEIFFWNWKKEPFYSIMKYKKTLFDLFKNGELMDVVKRLQNMEVNVVE
ncbi:hypothetical protein PVAND_008766 [Polypedilum vanderplanki]|uniref:SLC26A/SulP transporter domain-containing protein n=1 Tax=Polypedilum vanderplanki TaxID=319348 RepID=A0A9J6CBC1_POLVA|nr:hypothetical protein PVAND_008766 [Polypedilum vanderplanki]